MIETIPAPGLKGLALTTHNGGVPQNPKNRLFTEEDFTTDCETCFFWLHNPKLYSSRDACTRRKKEISHIATHAIDHHGLIRVTDPNNESRKFLLSCQNHDPTVKGKGNCAKCQSAGQWTETDLADPEHTGIALCIRCWCSFDMRGMKEHMTEKLCPYNTEQPKPKKMCILYTTFCSKTHPPSQRSGDNGSNRGSPKSAPRRTSRATSRVRSTVTQPLHERLPSTRRKTDELRDEIVVKAGIDPDATTAVASLYPKRKRTSVVRRRRISGGFSAINSAAAAIPAVTVYGGIRFHESEEIQRLNNVWARQESLRTKAGVEETKIYGGVKYERKYNGPFTGKLVSHGTIISINGEDYVEYRVLTKPSFF
ncbi:hypothetical protein ACJ41O_006001 [Fusarium nematophilum]